MDNSIRIKGEAYIRYHQDPISGFEAYSTKEQKVDAYLIKELKSVRLLKNHFQITLIFDESKNPQIDPLWAYPRRFTAKVRFKGKAPELLLKNFRSIKNVLN
jgi:effector-binding domain-containing protein